MKNYINLHYLTILALFLNHCGSNSSTIDGVKKDATYTAPTATAAPTSAPSPTVTAAPVATTTLTDIKRIMSYGPGITFNQLTGNSSDMGVESSFKTASYRLH